MDGAVITHGMQLPPPRRACNAKTTDRTGFERLREEQFTVIAADLNVFIQSTGMVEEWKFTDFRPLPVLYWY